MNFLGKAGLANAPFVPPPLHYSMLEKREKVPILRKRALQNAAEIVHIEGNVFLKTACHNLRIVKGSTGTCSAGI
jgi:hypothetical protein